MLFVSINPFSTPMKAPTASPSNNPTKGFNPRTLIEIATIIDESARFAPVERSLRLLKLLTKRPYSTAINRSLIYTFITFISSEENLVLLLKIRCIKVTILLIPEIFGS